jgi:hypothetical protein
MHIDPNGDPKTQAKQHVANLINTDVKNVTILSIEMIMKIIWKPRSSLDEDQNRMRKEDI